MATENLIKGDNRDITEKDDDGIFLYGILILGFLGFISLVIVMLS